MIIGWPVQSQVSVSYLTRYWTAVSFWANWAEVSLDLQHTKTHFTKHFKLYWTNSNQNIQQNIFLKHFKQIIKNVLSVGLLKSRKVVFLGISFGFLNFSLFPVVLSEMSSVLLMLAFIKYNNILWNKFL